MCGFGKHVNPFSKDKFMSIEFYKTILNQVGHISETVRLNGRGESTIHPDFCKILNYTKENYPDLRINLFSNLSFKNKNILKAIWDSNLQLFISFDSPFKEELIAIRGGAKYDEIITNISYFNQSKVTPFIVCTVQEKNLLQILDMAEFAMKNNCHLIYNTIRRDKGLDVFIERIKTNKREIENQFKKASSLFANSNLRCLLPDQMAGIQIQSENTAITNGTLKSCPVLEDEVCILFDGTVTPCNMFNPYVYGSLKNNTLLQVWYGDKRSDFIKNHQFHYYCNNCANLCSV